MTTDGWLVLNVERGTEVEVADLLPKACLAEGVGAEAWLPRLEGRLLLRGVVFVRLSQTCFARRLRGLVDRVSGFVPQVGRPDLPALVADDAVCEFRDALALRQARAPGGHEPGSRVWLLDRDLEAVVMAPGARRSLVQFTFLGRLIETSVATRRLRAV